jgi:uncharacterized protein (DUF58 family)
MLTRRGWWLLLTVLVVLFAALWTDTPGAAVLALTLLLWFVASWLQFQVRAVLVHGRLRVVRQVADAHGPVQSLWSGRQFRVRVRLVNDSRVGLVFARIDERVPLGVKRLSGTTHAEGRLGAEPLEVSYAVACPAPGVVRFEGLAVQFADVQGFFYRRVFVQAVRRYRILPPLADAKGRFPTAKRHNRLPLIGAHRHRRPGSGSELLDLRDYLPGDPPKMIAWKASARRDRLMTKEFESEVPIRCTLFVDTSASVRVGLPGHNALAGVVELAAVVAQANTRARDLTGLCLFDEHGSNYVKPARSRRQLVHLFNLLADAASLTPATGEAAVARLLPLAYGLAEEVYPQLLESELNAFPWWLPLAFPQPAASLRRLPPRSDTLGERLRRGAAYSRNWLFQNLAARVSPVHWRHYRWRKQLAAVLALRQGLGAGGIGLLLEDDERFVLAMQRFLNEHHVPFELPLYGPHGEYLFAAPAKVSVLARALQAAVGRGRDNELFVLLADLLDLPQQLGPLLAAVRLAAARHHHVLVVCPWPRGVAPPDRTGAESMAGERRYREALAAVARGNRGDQALRLVLRHTTALRLHRAFNDVRHAFARLGVSVLCAQHDDSALAVLHRMERLRVQERGVR